MQTDDTAQRAEMLKRSFIAEFGAKAFKDFEGLYGKEVARTPAAIAFEMADRRHEARISAHQCKIH